MLEETNAIVLGSETYSDEAMVLFADGDFDVFDDTGDIDPVADLDWQWSWHADLTAGTAGVRNETSGTKELEFEPGQPVTVNNDLDVNGTLTGGILGDSTFQFPSVGDDGSLEFRTSQTTTDQMFIIDRHGNSDYDIQLFQSDSQERVLTTGDEGSIDAGTLAGEDENYYATLYEDESFTGNITFTNQVTGTIDHAINADLAADADALGGVAAAEYLTTRVDVENSDTALASDVSFIDFGIDLDATIDGDGVRVDFQGGDIPRDVFDDGTLITDEADGFDFGPNLNAAISADHTGTVLDVTVGGTVANTDANETITSQWIHESPFRVDSRVTLGEYDGGYTMRRLDPTDYSRAIGFSDSNDPSGPDGFDLISSTDGVFTNVDLHEHGNRVATRTWSEDTFARGDGPEDLQNVAGDYLGQRRVDNGASTPSGHEELCLWVEHNNTEKWQIVGTETYIEVV